MPIDTSQLPALERELHMAKQVSAGGQPPRPDRIAAIEEQIKLVLDALGTGIKKAEKVVKAEIKAIAEKLETADAQSPTETADNKTKV